MGKFLKTVFENQTFSLCECTDGFWLYDQTRGMNLAMREKTEQAAFIEAIMYYQQRLLETEAKHRDLMGKVDTFLSQFSDDETNYCF